MYFKSFKRRYGDATFFSTRRNTVKKFVEISSRASLYTSARAIWNSARRRASKQKKSDSRET